jgi:hypothetical protein
MADHKEQLDRIEAKQDRLEKLLTGNGEPAKGLIVRVDRLEGFAERFRWAFRTVIGAAVFAAGEIFWRMFHGSK